MWPQIHLFCYKKKSYKGRYEGCYKAYYKDYCKARVTFKCTKYYVSIAG